MPELKALFVSSAAEAYGSERSLLGALDGVARIHVEVACPLGNELARELQARDIAVYGLEFNKYSFRKRPDWHARFFLRLNHILHDSKPDVVVINLGAHVPVISLACALRRIPVVHFQRFEFRQPRRFVDRISLRQANAIICPSRFVQQAVQAWLPEQAKQRAHYLYEPQQVKDFTTEDKVKIRQSLALYGKRLIGYFGRLHPGKRVETLLEALPLVRESFSDVHILIVGHHDNSERGSAYAAYLRQLADQPGCAGAVSFLGYRSDILELMAACNLVVLPSEAESFGRVLAESWAVAVPTIASDIGACKEVMEDSGGGLLFPVGDYKELADRIVTLLSDPILAQRLGQSGQGWVRRECVPSICGQKLEKILIDVA
ncbi:MAG: glycosyltransferase family 4 protein [Anaerolineae bacterium]